MKKQLPEYFAIKWSDNPLWRDYIKWLNETYNTNLNGSYSACFYGYDGFRVVYDSSLAYFKNPVTELTLEQWDNIVNKKENMNEYNIKVGDIITIISDFIVTKVTDTEIFLDSESSGYSFKRVNNNLKNNFWTLKKQDNMKEIIGYKLIKPEYREAACQIGGCILYGQSSILSKIFSLDKQSFAINKWKEAGVLDLWFEPVYKEEKTLPKINGYYGVLEKSYVVYGCAKFNIKYIEELHGLINRNKVLLGNKDIASITLDSGVEITIEQIKEIYEYIKSKN